MHNNVDEFKNIWVKEARNKRINYVISLCEVWD